MKLIRKLHFSLIALLIVNFMNAQAKPASSKEVATGKIKGADITINYSSPSVKAREIWGGLVPFNEVWRAGANEATTFETTKDIMVEGSKLPAGKYSFFVIPSAKECIIIFNKEAKQWGSGKYNEKEDQLRVKVKPQVAKSSAEKLVYTIAKNKMTLSWEKWNIPVMIK
ncbi:DUF2911 domain-containing protein [Flavobacterium weaverense]|uniref:DUF2911 family protein n=1 Tax=Flavobacterium weaverense TaxID=271156 RepID=A0A3L9ZXA9_9FLAO|nr:DUF2911 domain-containing protein [Flavobacterium weaverense]RMA75839.1 Protein of unknown function (DUF2911) [Flavobacterium weaverense]